MFRISFQPDGGFFRIQFHRWSLVWIDVKKDGKVMQFDTYAAARVWVHESGIAEGFDEQPTKGHPFRNGYGPLLQQ